MEYLDFESPLKELEDQLAECKLIGEKSDVDVSETCKKLLKKIDITKQDIYKNITPWQRVQLSRHPSRPYTLDYIQALTNGSFLELHGDRNIGDDKAMIGGFGKIDDQSFLFIGQQKGYNTKTRQYRNFGMANPGLEAEERGQGEAIARNIFEMFNIRTQIISIVIGEGASGGALGIAVGDHVMMLENTWYSVISPESCSSILWRSWDYKEKAAEALKLTPIDMKKNNLIDKIILEPLGGAHNNREKIFKSVKKAIVNSFNLLSQKNLDDLINDRMNKFTSMGVFDD